MTPQEIIKQVNDYRKSQGLAPLKVSDALMKAAQARANDMASTGSFSHTIATTTPNTHWSYFIKQNGYQYKNAGENLAEGYKNATDTMKAWQKSPTHNNNLINPKYSDMGVAVVPVKYNGKQSNFVIHFFGSPKNPQIQAVIPTSTPTPTTISAPPQISPKVIQQAVKKSPVKIPAPRRESLFTPIPISNANSTIPMVKQTPKVPMLTTQKG